MLNVSQDLVTKQYYIVMEFVEGGNLREILNIRKKLEPKAVLPASGSSRLPMRQAPSTSGRAVAKPAAPGATAIPFSE